jgi:hypothetical protein
MKVVIIILSLIIFLMLFFVYKKENLELTCKEGYKLEKNNKCCPENYKLRKNICHYDCSGGIIDSSNKYCIKDNIKYYLLQEQIDPN